MAARANEPVFGYNFAKRQKLYISLEDVPDLDFIWCDKEVQNFDILWNLDMPIKDIADQLKASEVSVMFLAFDRLLKGKIKPRDGWKVW